MYSKDIVAENESGLHARPASTFASAAAKFNSNITVTKDSKKVNAKSVIAILSLGVSKGSKIIITAEGHDEEAAELVARHITAKPDTVMGLATGSTPLLMYKNIIKIHREQGLSFSKVISFNLDEYIGISESKENSYHYYMWENFFNISMKFFVILAVIPQMILSL